jgi:hypothetical protein
MARPCCNSRQGGFNRVTLRNHDQMDVLRVSPGLLGSGSNPVEYLLVILLDFRLFRQR